jgi:L-asparaginase
MIFATGGTIAGRGSSSTASGVYQAGSIGVGALVDGTSSSPVPLFASP